MKFDQYKVQYSVVENILGSEKTCTALGPRWSAMEREMCVALPVSHDQGFL